MDLNVNDTEQRMIIAGFGGQGLLTAGKLLCRSCLAEGKNVTYLPSYGSEVRGGTANCHVVISQEKICSPSVDAADAMIILNELSMERFEKNIRPGGLLLLNSTLIDTAGRHPAAVNVFQAPVTTLAAGLGNVLAANIIMLGALVRLRRPCDMQSIESSIRNWLKSKGRLHGLELNLKALHLGSELAERFEAAR